MDIARFIFPKTQLLLVWIVILWNNQGFVFGADDLDPYPGDHRPWRSHRHIREALSVFDDNATTYEEIESRSVPGERTFKTHMFIDTFYRSGRVDRVAARGHLTIVNNPWSAVSVLEPGPQPTGGCTPKWWSSKATVTTTGGLHNCSVAMNAGFFRHGCLGALVSDRRLLSAGGGVQNSMFGIREDGTLVVGYLHEKDISSGEYRQLITGVLWLVRNGTSYVEESARLESDKLEDTGSLRKFIDVVSARTAIGYDSDGRVMIVHIEGQTGQRGYVIWKKTANQRTKDGNLDVHWRVGV